MITLGNWPYGTTQDASLMARARNFIELKEVAEDVILRMPAPVHQVCGPMYTGGGDADENSTAIAHAILDLRWRRMSVFSQLEYQMAMLRIMQTRAYRGDEQQILDEFYLPLFERRRITVLHFLEHWNLSTGAVWEHEQGTRLGMQIHYYLPDRRTADSPLIKPTEAVS